jgi:hypothetical protein
MAENQTHIVRKNRDHDGEEFLPRKSDGSEYQPGDRVKIENAERHYQRGLLGVLREDNDD